MAASRETFDDVRKFGRLCLELAFPAGVLSFVIFIITVIVFKVTSSVGEGVKALITTHPYSVCVVLTLLAAFLDSVAKAVDGEEEDLSWPARFQVFGVQAYQIVKLTGFIWISLSLMLPLVLMAERLVLGLFTGKGILIIWLASIVFLIWYLSPHENADFGGEDVDPNREYDEEQFF